MGMDVPAASMDGTRARLDQLKALKGRLSRQVGDARRQGVSTDVLVRELQQVSSTVKQLQKTLKKQLNDTPTVTKWVPPAITLPSAISARSVAGPISVSRCSPDCEGLADSYVANHTGGSIWHRPKVSEFIRATFGHRTSYFCAFDQAGRVVGVLPVIQLNSRLFGNFLVSMP
ncbi:MAG: hypothetical protein ACQEV6_05375 [Pseudomonadota bacterium]